MTFDFPALIAHAARTRRLGAGSVIGSGTVSNRDAEGGPGRPIAEGGRGYSCIAEQRTVETLLHGAAKTPFLKFGDRVRIEMLDRRGRSIFGRIEQKLERAYRRSLRTGRCGTVLLPPAFEREDIFHIAGASTCRPLRSQEPPPRPGCAGRPSFWPACWERASSPPALPPRPDRKSTRLNSSH